VNDDLVDAGGGGGVVSPPASATIVASFLVNPGEFVAYVAGDRTI